MEDDAIPQWALDEAVKRLNVGRTLHYNCDMHSTQVLARMIAKHENPPVDSDEEAVNRILRAAFPRGVIYSEDKARALAQYKKEIGRG